MPPRSSPSGLFFLPFSHPADTVQSTDGLLIGELAALCLLNECLGLVLKTDEIVSAYFPRAALGLDPIDGGRVLL